MSSRLYLQARLSRALHQTSVSKATLAFRSRTTPALVVLNLACPTPSILTRESLVCPPTQLISNHVQMPGTLACTSTQAPMVQARASLLQTTRETLVCTTILVCTGRATALLRRTTAALGLEAAHQRQRHSSLEPKQLWAKTFRAERTAQATRLAQCLKATPLEGAKARASAVPQLLRPKMLRAAAVQVERPRLLLARRTAT